MFAITKSVNVGTKKKHARFAVRYCPNNPVLQIGPKQAMYVGIVKRKNIIIGRCNKESLAINFGSYLSLRSIKVQKIKAGFKTHSPINLIE